MFYSWYPVDSRPPYENLLAAPKHLKEQPTRRFFEITREEALTILHARETHARANNPCPYDEGTEDTWEDSLPNTLELYRH